MKTYNTKAGVGRNSRDNDLALEIENGIAGSLFLVVERGSKIRIHRKNAHGIFFPDSEISVEEIIVGSSGL